MRRILNVGCGEENYGTHFVDLNPVRKGIVKCNVDEERLPFPNNYFDEVYSKNLIEHLRNPGFALKEMKRVLKPGGKIIIITDSATYWIWAIGKTHHGFYNSKFKNDRHYSIYSPEHLINHLKYLKFKRIKFSFISESSNFFVLLVDRILQLTPFKRFGFKKFIITALK